MKIERISDNMIKVTISSNDLEERNIDLQSLTYNSVAAQELLWDMMEQAELQYGFDFSNSHIVFEPLSDALDGFIITITRLDEDADFESLQKYIKNRLKKNDPRIRKKTRRILYPARIIYLFNSLDDICDIAEKIQSIFSGESYIYKLKNSYYLILKSIKPFNYRKLEVLLNEYGNKVLSTAFYEGYLNEYGTLMIEKNAINVLASYF
ncbi:MAG TPA: adaptor protein MecA [Clostridiales bacterium]|nr:adaptor protein MecA [Clostridiales bacterium]